MLRENTLSCPRRAKQEKRGCAFGKVGKSISVTGPKSAGKLWRDEKFSLRDRE